MLAEMFNQKKIFYFSTIPQGFGSFKGTWEHKKNKNVAPSTAGKILEFYSSTSASIC